MRLMRTENPTFLSRTQVSRMYKDAIWDSAICFVICSVAFRLISSLLGCFPVTPTLKHLSAQLTVTVVLVQAVGAICLSIAQPRLRNALNRTAFKLCFSARCWSFFQFNSSLLIIFLGHNHISWYCRQSNFPN